MCRNLAEGGRRCAAHSTRSASAERTIYHARRFFGANTVENRAKLATIPDAFINGSAAERVLFTEGTEDPVILAALQEKNPSPAFAKINLQAAILSNPNAGPDFLAERVDTRPVAKNFTIIENPAISDTTLETLVSTGAPSIRSAAMRKLVSRGAALEGFAANDSPTVRALVAAHTNDEALRNMLLRDPDSTVRQRAVTNTNLQDVPLPASIVNDLSPKVRELAARTTTDRGALRKLAADKDKFVARRAQENPARPEMQVPAVTELADISRYATLAEIGTDPRATKNEIATAYASSRATKEDRLALAKHPLSSVVMKQNHLEDLGGDWHKILSNDADTEPRILARLAKSKSTETRINVANHVSTDRVTLEGLAKSKNKEISNAAKETLKYIIE